MQIIISKLRLQRNILIFISGLMILSNCLLVIKINNLKIITRLIPTITHEQLISENFVNDEALRVRAKEIIWLLFSMKKENVDVISSSIIKQVDNSFVDDFKKQIDELALDIKNKNYRYVFEDSQGYEFDNHKFMVKVKGNLATYMAGKQISEKPCEYLISFINKGGMLTLKSFEEEKNAQEN